MKFGTMSIGSHMVVVVLIGFILIGYMLWVDPGTESIPLIIGAIGSVLLVLQKQAATDDKVIAVKADQEVTNKQVSRSIDVSEANAHTLAAVSHQTAQALEVVSQKVDGATEGISGVHTIVNSQRSSMLAQLDELRKAGEMRQEQLSETRAALARLEATLLAERADKAALIAAALATPTVSAPQVSE